MHFNAKNITTVFTLDEHQLTGRDFKASPRMEHSIGSFNKRDNQSKNISQCNESSMLQGAFNNKQPTTTLGMAGAQ